MEFQYIPPGANAPIATSSVYPPPEQPATQSTVTGLDAARQVDPVGNIIPQETSSLPNAPDATWSMPAAPPLENQNLQTQYGGLDGSSQVVNAPQDAVSPVSQEPERRVSVPRTESSPSAPTTHPEDNANNNSIDEDDGSEMDHIFSPLQNLSTQREDPSQSTSPSQQCTSQNATSPNGANAAMQLWASGRAAPSATSVLADDLFGDDNNDNNESRREKKSKKAKPILPKKAPSSRRVSMEVKQRREEERKAEREQAERERRHRNAEKAAEKKVIREAREIERRMQKDQVMADQAAEKDRRLSVEKERKEAQKEVERLKKAKQRMYPMDDAALIQIEESTPAPLSGALLQHGPTPDDHQVLGAAMAASEFAATFGVGEGNLLKIGAENGLKELPSFKELYIELVCPGVSLSNALTDFQVTLLQYILQLSPAVFANTLLRVDWPVDRTTWTEVFRTVIMQNNFYIFNDEEEAALQTICKDLENKDYNDLSPIQRATLLETLCNIALDCPVFRGRLDSVENSIKEMAQKEDEARKEERRECARLRDIEKAEKTRIANAKKRSQMGEAATVSDVTGVAEDDLAGQAIIDVLQAGGEGMEQQLFAKVKELGEAAGAEFAPDPALFTQVLELRGNYLGVDRGGTRYWLLRCDPCEVIMEHDTSTQLWRVTRDGGDFDALSEYIQPAVNDFSKELTSNQELIGLCNTEQTIRLRIGQTPPDDPAMIPILAQAEQRLQDIQDQIRNIKVQAEVNVVNRRLSPVEPARRAFGTHQAPELRALLSNLPEKSIREGALKRALTERIDAMAEAVEDHEISKNQITGIVKQRDQIAAEAMAAGDSRHADKAKLPIEDVRTLLLDFEENIDMDEYYVNKEAYMEARGAWIDKVKSAVHIHELTVYLLELQAAIADPNMKTWWKNDIETWQASVRECHTAALLRLLLAWYFRAFKRMPGTALPEPEIIEDLRAPKKKQEPEVDRREKRRLERLEKDIELAKEESLKKQKKTKQEKHQQEQELIEEEEGPWGYDGMLPAWAVEGSLVWAKVWGFPWWPALINAPEEANGRKRRPSKADQVWVYNLGAGNFSEVHPIKSIVPYTPENTKKFGAADKIKASLRKDLKKAMKAANEILKEIEAAGPINCGEESVPVAESAVKAEADERLDEGAASEMESKAKKQKLI